MKKKPAWTKKAPTVEGWYWYREDGRSVILHVFEPHAKGHWKAWDWQDGRHLLCAVADYPGEWYGPLEVPV